MSWKISGDLPEFGYVFSSYQISPDGKFVVYEADANVDSLYELFSVPILGGEMPASLNPSMANGGSIKEFTITPNSLAVVYRSDIHLDEKFELYAVPIHGGNEVRLDAIMDNNGDVEHYAVTSDSNKVVFLADKETNDKFELFVVPITGGNPLKLNGALGAAEDVVSFAISPNGLMVVYLVGEYVQGGRNDSGLQLYAVPIIGGTPQPLNPPLPENGKIYDYQIGPGSQRVVYRAKQDAMTMQVELYSVPLLGGVSKKLNLPLEGELGYGSVSEFKITPNGLGVVYLAPQDEFRVFELYSTDMNGVYHFKLNQPIFTWLSIIQFEITPDSSHVVYLGDPNGDRICNLYSNSILGGNPVQLNADLIIAPYIHDFAITSNSQGVVFRDDQGDLYGVYLDGSSFTNITGDMPLDHYVIDFIISPNDLAVVYRARMEGSGTFDIFLDLFTGGDAVKLNETFPGEVTSFKISPDSKRVFYQRSGDLYVVLDGGRLYMPMIIGNK